VLLFFVFLLIVSEVPQH